MVLNSDAGGALLGDDGKPSVYGMQAAEKTYVDFEVTFTNPGGHSSRPGPDNAIYRLAARDRPTSRHSSFRSQTSELTLAYFRAAGALTPGEEGAAMRRYRRRSRRCGCHCLPASQARIHRAARHDLRRDHAQGRACPERAAAECDGERQLPRIPGCRHRQRRGNPGARNRRSDGADRRSRASPCRATPRRCARTSCGRFAGPSTCVRRACRSCLRCPRARPTACTSATSGCRAMAYRACS